MSMKIRLLSVVAWLAAAGCGAPPPEDIEALGSPASGLAKPEAAPTAALPVDDPAISLEEATARGFSEPILAAIAAGMKIGSVDRAASLPKDRHGFSCFTSCTGGYVCVYGASCGAVGCYSCSGSGH